MPSLYSTRMRFGVAIPFRYHALADSRDASFEAGINLIRDRVPRIAAMKIAVLKEAAELELRVPIVPDSVKRFAQKKIEVVVQTGAGARALAADADYEKEGAKVEANEKGVIDSADAIVRLRTPSLEEISRLKEGSVLVAPLLPLVNHDLVKALAARKISAFSVDAIPRTHTRANDGRAVVAGHVAPVITPSFWRPRSFRNFCRCSSPPQERSRRQLRSFSARASPVFRRSERHVVSARASKAFDVRKVAKEQVESLGAKFIEVDSGEDAQTAGGYAKEVSEEYKKKQSELLAKHVAKADCVITTALIPGKRAPILITEEMVKAMKPGSVIVDLAAEQQGNCELTEAGKIVVKHGVTIIGDVNLTSHLAVHASHMYSRNMEKFFFHLTKDGALKFDMSDEITAGCLITHGGEIVQAKTKEAIAGAAA